MAKRFTNAQKWRDPWYTDLPPLYKLLWCYICDCCDNAGVWDMNAKLAAIEIGEEVDWVYALRLFEGRVRQIAQGRKWFIVKFIEFQYGELREKSHPHAFVLRLLRQHGLTSPVPVHRVVGGVVEGVVHTPKEKEKETDKDMEKDSNARASGDDLFAVPSAALTVSAPKVPAKTVGDLVALGAAVGREDRGDWEAALKARSFDVLAAGIVAVRARGAKAWLNVVIDEIDKSGLAAPAPETYMEIDGVRYRVHGR